MPSSAPPARSAWWAVIIPVVLLVAAIAWAMSSFAPEPQTAPQRGVRTTSPQPASPAPPREEPRAPEPEALPESPRAPVPGNIPVPEPSPESGRLDETAPRGTPIESDIPEWKWSLARRRVQITMYAAQWCGVCRTAREYMKTNQIDFIELDIEDSSTAGERLGELNPARTVPTFEIDGEVYIGFREDQFGARIQEAARKHL